MTTTTPNELSVPPVRVLQPGPWHELRAVKVVWQRDLVRFVSDRSRLVSSMVQPLLFLFVLGKGLGATLHSSNGLDYSTFLFPGTLTTGVMFTAVFSAISIVWDREFGFLREMLVAPVARGSIVLGKCLGGASVATVQGVILLALAGLVGVPYQPLLLLGCLAMLFITAFAITAFGMLISVRVAQIQTVMPRVQLLLMPLMFLSGSLFPVGGNLPTWLRVLTRINPMSYAVDAVRRVVFHYLPGRGVGTGLHSTMTWGGWVVPAWLDVIIVAGVGVVLLYASTLLFSRTE